MAAIVATLLAPLIFGLMGGLLVLFYPFILVEMWPYSFVGGLAFGFMVALIPESHWQRLLKDTALARIFIFGSTGIIAGFVGYLTRHVIRHIELSPLASEIGMELPVFSISYFMNLEFLMSIGTGAIAGPLLYLAIRSCRASSRTESGGLA